MTSLSKAHQLAGIVEIDDAFFGSPMQGSSKRGRGTSKTAVRVEASLPDDAIGFAKMTVVNKVDGATVEHVIKADGASLRASVYV